MENPIKVGAECEAWCGPCKGLHDHVIVAMVDEQPKQVQCRSCGNRHNFRLAPARSAQGVGPRPTRAEVSQVEKERRKKQEGQVTFERELREAPEVRPFDKRERYKAGQIIEHPQLGRGKVENILKGALLVRFASGLKNVMTS